MTDSLLGALILQSKSTYKPCFWYRKQYAVNFQIVTAWPPSVKHQDNKYKIKLQQQVCLVSAGKTNLWMDSVSVFLFQLIYMTYSGRRW